MEAPILLIETKVDRFIEEVLFEGELAVAFHGFVMHSADDQVKVYKKYQEGLKDLLTSLSEAELGPALSHFVKLISTTKNHQKSKLLFSLLEYGVTNNFVSARLVCETLLKCESLVYHNEDFWCFSFMLINKIISGIDYKGVRDLLKTILDKAQGIKSAVNVAVMNQLRAIQNVLETIFDRKDCLLPSYLILDELQKKLPARGSYPHWKFSKLISSFIDSFRPTAQMVSISVFMDIKGDETAYGRSKLLPVVGHSATLGNVWKLDPVTAKAPLRGLLPYNKELLEPQTSLLKYVLEQPYSREMVCSMLGVSKQQKQRCPVLEEQLVELIVSAMEKSENEIDSMEDGGPTQLLWQHLSSQLIYFVLFQYASFPHIIMILHNKLLGRNLRKGRDHLMWVLLQFISGSIQKNLLNDFLPVMKLYDLLYPEKEPLPFPDVTRASSCHALAITSVWIHLMKKAQVEQVRLQRRLPVALSGHLEYLQNCLNSDNLSHTLNTDYRIPLLCNAYSTNQECFTRPMAILVEAVQDNQKQQTSHTGGAVTGPIKPLSMSVLDSLTVHTKMSLIHNVVTHVMKLAQAKSAYVLSPALVETYSRLLVYSEIESLGIKGFITHLLPTVLKNHAWGILHTLLEMFSYRLHHFQPHYRVQLLNHLHSLTAVTQTNQTQLHLCVQSTALKLIAGMGSAEVQPLLSRLPSEPKSLLSNESEELNKVLVLTIARAIHVTGSESLSGTWCKEILTTIMQHTPHNWSSFTLQCFPNVLADFFYHHQAPKENKSQLKRSVEEEYKKWKTMSNENDIIIHFSGSSPLFLCLLWKMLLDNDRISTIAYQILDRIGARALSAHLRTFADFLVYEFAISPAGQHVNKYVDALNDLIWKCHVIQLDRLILCLSLRSFEGDEAQVCFLIIRMLLLKSQEFKNRVYDFVKYNSPEHWKQSDWHEKHLMFHRVYQEKFYFEGLRDFNAQHTYIPIYFGNVCLRFLPVMDIVIHRFLELPTVTLSFECLLDTLGCLYKFHDRPLTYLYNTLHYYEQRLRDRPPLKKKLVSAIIGSLKDVHPEGWALSEGYIAYTQDTSEELNWIPDHDYYVKLIGRLVDTLGGKSPFPHTDWRFNEFPNQGAHALHVTCIELMALPVSTTIVGNVILDVVLKGRTVTVHSNIVAWMNAVGLVLTALPEAYWSVLNDRILDVMQSPLLSNPLPEMDPFLMFDFAGSYNSMTELPCSYVVALTHAVWYHASIGQICTLTQLLKLKFKPAVKNEVQFIFICHLVAPFLQRFYLERTRYAMEITVELYEMLEAVDKNCEQLLYIDAVCDLLYHIKYMFIGDAIKNEIEKSIRNLRPAIQRKLRFITHLNIEEGTTT
ncbi:mediator of RNA polymerase II transcription subunit 23 [Trichonephila inaurata madagascariensis]|uniref:Mediator of RNA polymerase II transcription subunit 23 n=1 Tax=Trichonephila inaurata madagascariensis TaxID=2747483 RepID=A0A8X6WZH3_9ARAC|nr:mediator of RNA polymerase II transcription subunit 23 [Trichonephila inaurata madagascariensis]